MPPTMMTSLGRVAMILATVLTVAPTAGAKTLKPLSCMLVINADSGAVLHRDGTCDQRFTPASTFKLPLALIGYDSGILVDAQTPRWDYKPEFKRSEREQKTTDPVIWEKESIVWYSQEITRRLGAEKFSGYVEDFNYGSKDTSGDPGKTNGLTQSWLSSSLQISPEEQVGFLRRALRGELPVAAAAVTKMIEIVPHFEAADGWDVQGKTGLGSLRNKDGSLAENRPVAWFVGWAVKDQRRVIFAHLTVGVEKSAGAPSIEARQALLAALPGLVKPQP